MPEPTLTLYCHEHDDVHHLSLALAEKAFYRLAYDLHIYRAYGGVEAGCGDGSEHVCPLEVNDSTIYKDPYTRRFITESLERRRQLTD